MPLRRDPASHKGDNGKVAIIGGSAHQHGAPLFSALAAEASGVDLLYVVLPERHAEVAKQTSLNFQIHPFAGDELKSSDVEWIVELLATLDTAVVGPGLSRSQSGLKVIRELIESAPCTMVLDASALQPWTLRAASGKHAVLTPHLGELERMNVRVDALSEEVEKAQATVVLKSEKNMIVSEQGEVKEIAGGNAGLTVGGTGDAMAGLLCGLIAQGMDHFEAGVAASTIIKRAGAMLSAQHGCAYGARRVIEQIPHLLATL